MTVQLSASKMVYARLALRTLQFVWCVLAMTFSLAGLVHVYDSGVTHSAVFVLLTSYTGVLYTLWLLVSVKVLRVTSRPPLRLEQGLDVLLSLLLLVAGICLAASKYVHYCSSHFDSKCGNLRAAVAFTFISMFFFLATFGLTFVPVGEHTQSLNQDMQEQDPVPYRMETTPVGALSPLNDPREAPAARV